MLVYATMIILGFPGEPTWEEAVAFLHKNKVNGLLVKLHEKFYPSSMTLDMTRRLVPIAKGCTSAIIERVNKTAVTLAIWVQTVCANAVLQERRLSNYAVLSPQMTTTPMAQLSKYYSNPWGMPPIPSDVLQCDGPAPRAPFCWQQDVCGM